MEYNFKPNNNVSNAYSSLQKKTGKLVEILYIFKENILNFKNTNDVSISINEVRKSVYNDLAELKNIFDNLIHTSNNEFEPINKIVTQNELNELITSVIAILEEFVTGNINPILENINKKNAMDGLKEISATVDMYYDYLEKAIEKFKQKNTLSGGKKPVKKSPVKKSPVKKSPVKKSPVKKSPVKKSPVKKSPVKKSPVKKSPVKKSPVKKSPVKKSAVKK